MDGLVYELKNQWMESNIEPAIPATNEDILSFQSINGFILPNDIIKYFIELNGSSDQYENRFFKFYSLSQFVTVKDELFEWEGVPNYKNIIKTMPFHESCFVFSDYDCHSFTYAIRLYREVTKINEVYIISGDKYKLIANSLSEFMSLYLKDSLELYFDD